MEQIGFITKPQGIKGEFRARIDNASKEDLKNLKEITINKTSYPVKKVTFREGFVIFNVEGINDCNQVELLRNVPIFAEIDYTLEDDEVLISDIIGFSVVLDNGAVLGELASVDSYGTAEVYTVKTNNGEVLFPNARGVIEEFEMEKHQIILNAQVLDEIRIDN